MQLTRLEHLHVCSYVVCCSAVRVEHDAPRLCSNERDVLVAQISESFTYWSFIFGRQLLSGQQIKLFVERLHQNFIRTRMIGSHMRANDHSCNIVQSTSTVTRSSEVL